MVAVGRMDRGEDVPVDVVPPEDVKAADDPVIGRLAALIDAVGVVQRPRAVDRDPDEEVLLAQERAPVVVQERAVVWIVLSTRWPGLAYSRSISIERRKKSSPIMVGSPPCQATTTSGARSCAASNWRM